MSQMILEDDSGNQFRISARRLGMGTFAEVFLGDWLDPPKAVKKVAVKKFKNAMSKKTMAMLHAEIDIMQSLDHPNVVKMISFVKRDQLSNDLSAELFVVLEYCEGGDFKHFIKGKRMAEKHACGYMKQLASGLMYLHSKSIIHRDLKPHNILLTADKKIIKIADFGLAKVAETKKLSATMCGSPMYMAPEVIMGQTYSANADLWSVGVILYEVLCGERPFNETSVPALLRTLDNEPIKYKREVKDSISQECKGLLVGLLQKNPSQRIDFDDFFSHKWFQKCWDEAKPKSPSNSVVMETSNRVKLTRTAPVKIPSQRSVIGGHPVVGDYSSRLSSAPARICHVPNNSLSPPPNSVFLSTTPQGHQSDGGFGQSMTQSRSGMFVEMMSTGFSLLRDSFQSNGF